MKAIPTTYDGINFRSRLEAKWANFFNIIGWPYEYEPIDLGGYIPDFLIKGSHSQVFVEVKPATTLSELKELCNCARQKTPGKRLLCLGAIIGFTEDWLERESIIGLDVARLNICEDWYANMMIDIYGKGNGNQAEWDVDDESTIQAIIGHYEDVSLIECKECRALNPVSEAYSRCIFCGGKRQYRDLGESNLYAAKSFEYVKEAWKEAGNRVQWQNGRKGFSYLKDHYENDKVI